MSTADQQHIDTAQWWLANEESGQWDISPAPYHHPDRADSVQAWALVFPRGIVHHAYVFCHAVDVKQCAINAWRRAGFSRAPQEATA